MIGASILHYKVIAELGRGGMGIVYKAEDTKLKRDVAIKFLPHRIAINDEERERFRIEAQAAAALNHPNISTIYAIEETEDDMFIVMEYIEGKELREMVVEAHNYAPLPFEKIITYATQIAEGLRAAHEKGVIHRDIKPSNIMITTKDQVKIMDFGLAKLPGGTRITKVGTALGTVAYMSPEQVTGQEVDQRSDIWSLGVVLYEMLTGKLPFPSEYEQVLIYSILHDEPNLEFSTPFEFMQIIKKALSKNPGERYSGIAELLDELNKCKDFIRPDSIPAKSSASIVVLPFINLSSEKENEYFSDGMTEELINGLAKIKHLHVVSRTSGNRLHRRGDQEWFFAQRMAGERPGHGPAEGTAEIPESYGKIKVRWIYKFVEAPEWCIPFLTGRSEIKESAGVRKTVEFPNVCCGDLEMRDRVRWGYLCKLCHLAPG
jgi:non-specific serine/threonine protein kinase